MSLYRTYRVLRRELIAAARQAPVDAARLGLATAQMNDFVFQLMVVNEKLNDHIQYLEEVTNEPTQTQP